MRLQNMVLTVFATVLGLVAVPASAVSIEVQLSLDGVEVGNYDAADLGCTDNDGTPTANCSGTNAYWGGYDGIRVDSWNLFLDEDPVVSASTSITNLGPLTQQITLLFNLPIAPAIPGGTVIGGSIQGGATDNNGNGVTLSAPTGSSFYTALIDGSPVDTLYDDPSSYSAGTFLSLSVPFASFGTPIPSQAAGPALASIGIKLDFLLTPGDTATFSGVFVVQPAVIPIPGAVWLFGGALGLLGWLRRR